MYILEIIIAFLSSICVIIGLCAKLYKTAKQLIAEKNYIKLTEYAMQAVIYAENFASMSGQEKKRIAISYIHESAEKLNIQPPSDKLLADIIEKIIDVSKNVNAKGR